MLKLFCMSSIQAEAESVRACVRLKLKDDSADPLTIYSKPTKVNIKQGQNTFKFDYECVDQY